MNRQKSRVTLLPIPRPGEIQKRIPISSYHKLRQIPDLRTRPHQNHLHQGHLGKDISCQGALPKSVIMTRRRWAGDAPWEPSGHIATRQDISGKLSAVKAPRQAGYHDTPPFVGGHPREATRTRHHLTRHLKEAVSCQGVTPG